MCCPLVTPPQAGGQLRRRTDRSVLRAPFASATNELIGQLDFLDATLLFRFSRADRPSASSFSAAASARAWARTPSASAWASCDDLPGLNLGVSPRVLGAGKLSTASASASCMRLRGLRLALIRNSLAWTASASARSSRRLPRAGPSPTCRWTPREPASIASPPPRPPARGRLSASSRACVKRRLTLRLGPPSASRPLPDATLGTLASASAAAVSVSRAVSAQPLATIARTPSAAASDIVSFCSRASSSPIASRCSRTASGVPSSARCGKFSVSDRIGVHLLHTPLVVACGGSAQAAR